jgi:hypothetical protein
VIGTSQRENASHQGEDRYHRTALDNMRLGEVSTEQLRHALWCRIELERLDGETVAEELYRLALQACEETTDAFARITNLRFDKSRAERLASEAKAKVLPMGSIDQRILTRIAYGMLRDGWAEHQVAYGLSTLGASDTEAAA